LSSMKELTKYMVIKILSGRREVVDAVYEYFVLDISPKQIADRYGLTINQVRGYAQRILGKTHSLNKAKVLLKYIYPHITGIEPVIEKNICRICRRYVYMPENHINSFHRDIINTYTMKIISEVFTWMKH